MSNGRRMGEGHSKEDEAQPQLDEAFRYSDYVSRALKDDSTIPNYLKGHLSFSASIADRDDATAVIRGMSFVEAMVLALIRDNLEHPDLIKEAELALRERLLWARALSEMSKEFAMAIDQASRIRNKFAHRLSVVNIDTDIDPQMVRELIKKVRTFTTGQLVDLEPVEGISKAKWQVRMAIQVLVNELITLWWNPFRREKSRRVQTQGIVGAWEGEPPIPR